MNASLANPRRTRIDAWPKPPQAEDPATRRPDWLNGSVPHTPAEPINGVPVADRS
ncbi:hypothetical protein SAMN04489712_13219 [Thermomonospora echinospora]|uniref:Uncharacterized protein n=1 Tax=Thermomonospora echinospora TaxID=1992 RepID=A0A1H6E393_9ACTN|nr:hypothetical protein [Thermomonospora echinospora]SEG92090.1 hypothetical protein SAMN04489712_13219 [Thermomonospora echinospora]